MAIMHPESLANYDATESEKVFFDSLEKQLDDNYHVFYSVKWYSKDSNGRRINSECDFLVFNSNFGYLTIEVKGGKKIEVCDRHWILHFINNKGEPATRDLGKGPYDQADKSMYYFYDYYKNETFSRFQGSYGMAVAFPFYNLDVDLENDAPRDLTIQFSDMDNLNVRINEIFHYWSKRNKGNFLSNSQATKFINLVNKRIALSVAAGALIPITERKLETINIVQDSVITLLTNYKRAQIIGGAGTGKTWIAIKKLKLEALNNKTCLFTSYNEHLVYYVKKQLPDVDCIPVEELFSRNLSDAELQSLPKDKNGDVCYNDAVERKAVKRYDCIAIDEAQDFTEDWAKTIKHYTKENGTIWIFFDENQNIYSRTFENGFGIDTLPFILLNNIRNTRNIHTWIKEKTQIGEQIISNDVCGCDPEIHDFNNLQQVEVFLNSTLVQLINEEGVARESLVVIVNDGTITEWDGKQSGPFRLSQGSFGENEVRVATVSSYKGLEASIVIYINQWPKDLVRTEAYYNRLYVAGTRAKYYLYVINYAQ